MWCRSNTINYFRCIRGSCLYKRVVVNQAVTSSDDCVAPDHDPDLDPYHDRDHGHAFRDVFHLWCWSKNEVVIKRTQKLASCKPRVHPRVVLAAVSLFHDAFDAPLSAYDRHRHCRLFRRFRLYHTHGLGGFLVNVECFDLDTQKYTYINIMPV